MDTHHSIQLLLESLKLESEYVGCISYIGSILKLKRKLLSFRNKLKDDWSLNRPFFEIALSKHMYLIFFSGKATTARSPQESDRSNLLREAEPVGYSSTPSHDPFADDAYDEDDLAVHTGGGYQSRAAARPTSLNTGSRNAPRNAPRGPPRGIFDDI